MILRLEPQVRNTRTGLESRKRSAGEKNTFVALAKRHITFYFPCVKVNHKSLVSSLYAAVENYRSVIAATYADCLSVVRLMSLASEEDIFHSKAVDGKIDCIIQKLRMSREIDVLSKELHSSCPRKTTERVSEKQPLCAAEDHVNAAGRIKAHALDQKL